MPDLAYETIHSSLAAQPLFEAKSWQLSPQAWPVTPAQKTELEQIGTACLAFHAALETLYLRSVAGKTCSATSRWLHRGWRITSIAANRRN